MRRSRCGLVVFALVAGCGRVSFDARDDGGASGDATGGSDAAMPPSHPALVQRVGWSNYASGTVQTIPNTLPNDTLIVAIDVQSGTDHVAQVADDVGNTYTSANVRSLSVTNPGGAVVSEIWYAVNVATGPVQLTVTATAAMFWDVTVLEMSGVATTSPIDRIATLDNAPGSTTTANGAPVTTLQAFDAVVVINSESTSGALGAGSLFTNFKTAANDDVAYALTTTPGPYEATFTCPSACGVYNVSSVAFKAAQP